MQGKHPNRRWLSLLVLLLLAGGLPGSARGATAQDRDGRQALLTLQEAFVGVAQAVRPSVVNISTTKKPRDISRRQVPPFFRGPFRDFFGEDFFERFFGDIPQREVRSLGSGVIVDKRGYILTNNHVIEQAEEIEVRLADKQKFKGQVVGKDPKTDLAVIKIEPKSDLPAARLGDSGKIRIGEWAIAIGSPFGLEQTVTVGVISAVGRSDVGIATYEDFIQTDASINPGNSGGPLINIFGEVIGINTAIVATGQGIGFAIPINMGREIKDRLIAQGKVVRGWLGIGIQELTEELASQFGVKPEEGVLVSNVMKDGPAEKGGLKTGDIIVEFDGTKVGNVRALQRQVAGTPVGKRVPVKVLRERRETTVLVALGEQPADLTAAAAPGGEAADRYGFAVQELTPELREQLRLDALEGILISGVEEGSPAARAGIRPGDVVTEVNREPVRNLREFTEALRNMRRGSNLLLLLVRNGASRFVVLSPKQG